MQKRDNGQKHIFRQTNNPLELIIETWKRIEERNYTRTWAKVLVLKPKKPYKRAGGRKKRGRNNSNNDSGDYLAMNVSEVVEVAAAAVRRSKRSRNRTKQRIGQG
eukprot:scaffold12223_cov109-Skeletonema_dohrnii-CCMP3373.AAC.1